ncbi:MAG: hypothetical protein NWE89_12320 [Candidatus Bathyarchaeota archaeon]|nr:hypothetical protein [Candidatus Bathyarchaeota archaeon]
MNTYKHKEIGYKIEAEYDEEKGWYVLHHYPRSELIDCPALHLVILSKRDFEKLFELAPMYCCDWFARCVEREVFRRSTASRRSGQVWAWDALDEYFDECPFCKTKL